MKIISWLIFVIILLIIYFCFFAYKSFTNTDDTSLDEIVKLHQEKNNLELFYSQSDGYAVAKAAWAEYLQLNPSQEGIDYFFKRTLGKFDLGYLYQLEILMCKNFVWDLATCRSKPLTSIDRSKLLNGK